MKDWRAVAVSPFMVTDIGALLAPGGTDIVNEVVDDAVTGARTIPKYTILSADTVLKLLPVMVTVELIGPDSGEKEVMTGWETAENPNNKRMRLRYILLQKVKVLTFG